MRSPQERAALDIEVSWVVADEPSHRVGECQQLDNRWFGWLHHRDEVVKPADNGTDSRRYYPARLIYPAMISAATGV